jgi:capsular exopolysaccharide synthesis family protein
MSVPNFQALAANAPTSLPGPAVTFADLKRALLNHWQIFGLTVGAIVALVAVYVFQLPNVYTSTCTIQVDRKISAPVKMDKDSSPGTSGDTPQAMVEFMRTQERILNSRALAERIITRLNLKENKAFNPLYQGAGAYQRLFSTIRGLIMGANSKSDESLGDPDDPLNPTLSPELEGLIKEYYKILEVKQLRNANVFDISSTTTSRQLSVRIANAHADEYMKFIVEQRFGQAAKNAEFLQTEADKIKQRLADSEQALQNYREKTSLSTTPDSEQKILEDIRSQLTKSKSELAKFEERYLEKHPKLIEARSTTAKLEHELKTREDKLMELRSKTVGFDSLNRQIEADRVMFKNVLEKLKELNIQSTVASTNITVVDQAQIAKEKSGPSRVKTIALSAIAAILLATGLSLGLELTNQTIRTPEDIATTLAAPFLGYIPHCKSQSAALMLLAKDQEVDRALMESYRTIQAVLRYQPESADARVILITSACPDEGKTYNAVHFARSYAEIGFRTLLVEADLRRPSIPRITGMSETPSLIAACSPDATGEPDLMALSQKTTLPKLRVIVAGGSTLASPEILSSNRFREILAVARNTFDRIVIDTPPLGALGDVLGLTTLVDGVIWVTRFGKIKKRIVKTAFERLHQIKANILGVVINDLDRKRLGSSYYYDYNRYGGDYYNTEKKSPKPRNSPAIPNQQPINNPPAQAEVHPTAERDTRMGGGRSEGANNQSPTANHQQPITHNQPPTTHKPIPATTQQPPKITIVRPPTV